MPETETAVGQDSVLIFRAWITDPKTGERIYARDYGMRGFPIRIPKKAP